jgi:hypothetical protein
LVPVYVQVVPGISGNQALSIVATNVDGSIDGAALSTGADNAEADGSGAPLPDDGGDPVGAGDATGEAAGGPGVA